MAIEKPSHIVMVTEGSFELRKYSSYIVAETHVEGDFEAVGSEGFRRLADYIGGKNRKKESISMTAPVSQKPASKMVIEILFHFCLGIRRMTFPSRYHKKSI